VTSDAGDDIKVSISWAAILNLNVSVWHALRLQTCGCRSQAEWS